MASSAKMEADDSTPAINGEAVNGESKQSINDAPQTLEEAIEAAMLAKKVYGATSAEARMAFEIVEEMDAASR